MTNTEEPMTSLAAPGLPPRKGVMAWDVEPMEENGDEFFVLTFHHGLGRMTRLDLSEADVRDLAAHLVAVADETGYVDGGLTAGV